MGNENIAPAPPHDNEKSDEQLPGDLPTENPQLEQPPNPAQRLTEETLHENTRLEEPVNVTL